MVRLLSFFVCLFCLLNAGEAHATKPCFNIPCSGDDCKVKATWIAEGKVKNIKSDYMGDPLYKNFMNFTFEITKWIKPPSGDEAIHVKKIDFKVGWCHNPSLPDGIKEKGILNFYSEKENSFLFYGANDVYSPSADGEVPRYHKYERIK